MHLTLQDKEKALKCSCVTKTPELAYHDDNCNYRVYSELASKNNARNKITT